VPEVRGVVHGSDRWMGRGELVRDARRLVPGAVVDNDDLERLGERGQRGQRLRDEALEVGRLVVGREEVGQRRQLRSGRGTCQGGDGCHRRGHRVAASRPLTAQTPRLPPLATRVMSNWLVSSSRSRPSRRITKTGRVPRKRLMTSGARPRFSSSMVRSSTILMSGRSPSTFWAYQSVVEVLHQLTSTAPCETAG